MIYNTIVGNGFDTGKQAKYHVHILGLFDRRGYPGEVHNRTQADIQVQLLAQCNVQRAGASG
jgi:hypothetical protein